MPEKKYAVKNVAELPKQTWLRPLPYMVREIGEDGAERGRWLRVYANGASKPVILRTVPERNTIIELPEGLIPAGA